MKKTAKLLTIIFCSIGLFSYGQITINDADMPVAGDTFNISIKNNLQGFDLSLTGQNYNWDFSQLQESSQTVDTFFNILATQYIPASYNLSFNNPLDDEHRANAVTRDFNTHNPMPQIQISEYYYFYKNSSSGYSLVGQGAKINSVPTPMKYDVPESIFKFPLTYGSVDSTVSKYNLNIPGVGYYGETIKHVNTVDGYGTLKTPYGTFNVMRVKSVINTTDTIYLDTLGFGTHLNKPLETRYSFLGDNQGVPLLQITKINNNITARYKDFLSTSSNVNDIINKRNLLLFPNPATDVLKINTDETIGKVEILNILGQTVLISESSDSHINVSQLKKGVYMIRVYRENGPLLTVRKFVKE